MGLEGKVKNMESWKEKVLNFILNWSWLPIIIGYFLWHYKKQKEQKAKVAEKILNSSLQMINIILDLSRLRSMQVRKKTDWELHCKETATFITDNEENIDTFLNIAQQIKNYSFNKTVEILIQQIKKDYDFVNGYVYLGSTNQISYSKLTLTINYFNGEKEEQYKNLKQTLHKKLNRYISYQNNIFLLADLWEIIELWWRNKNHKQGYNFYNSEFSVDAYWLFLEIIEFNESHEIVDKFGTPLDISGQQPDFFINYKTPISKGGNDAFQNLEPIHNDNKHRV